MRAWGLIPDGGFRWADAEYYSSESHRQENCRVLMPVKYTHNWKAVDIHRIPGLHRKFARLPQTEDAIVEFANQYGWLGVRGLGIESVDEEPVFLVHGIRYPKSIDINEVHPHGIEVEPFDTWQCAISRMHEAVTIWDYAIHKKIKELRALLRPLNIPMPGTEHFPAHTHRLIQCIYCSHPDNCIELPIEQRGVIQKSARLIPRVLSSDTKRQSASMRHALEKQGGTSGHTAVEMMDKSPDEILMSAAVTLVLQWVNAHLDTWCKIRVGWDKYMVSDMLAENLWGGLWLWFAGEIGGGEKWDFCFCGTSFEKTRSDQEYCSKKCKQKKYRMEHPD